MCFDRLRNETLKLQSIIYCANNCDSGDFPPLYLVPHLLGKGVGLDYC
jgi:hypothetical protein